MTEADPPRRWLRHSPGVLCLLLVGQLMVLASQVFVFLGGNGDGLNVLMLVLVSAFCCFLAVLLVLALRRRRVAE